MPLRLSCNLIHPAIIDLGKTNMSNQRSITQRLADATLHLDSIEKVQVWRNAALGGAAACLVILTGLLQVTDKSSNAFFSAALFISVSLPCWVATSSTYETYVLLGVETLPHLQSTTMKKLLTVLLGVSGFSLWGSVASTLAILSGYAAGAFVAMSLAALVFASMTNLLLARWWFRPGGPGANDIAD